MEKQFKKVRAIFNPAKEHEHTLREEYKQFIGKEFVFQYMYVMEEEDMYSNIWALMPLLNKEEFVTSWVPEFDLEILEEVA